jgi:hypothetical protein
MMRTANFQVIFQSANGEGDRWLDYCREQAPVETLAQAEAWAATEAKALERRMGFGVRFRIEDWSE